MDGRNPTAVGTSQAAQLEPPFLPSAKDQHPTDAARQFVQKLATDKLRTFEATIDPATGEYRDDIYAQNRSLSEHVAADYHGRFLIELIQNGNDAHPRDQTDGEIEVLLADEGQHWTVYVANRGSPFSQDGVSALTRIGKSSKPPGEAIGNKGLGFRSVSHVCDAPEIYSQCAPSGSKPAFDGFCFALEQGRALDCFFDDPRIRELARKDLPMFSVPRWLPEQPRLVQEFAQRGFATVVRLILRDEEARKDAVGQLRLLANQAAPTLLFMERLCRLTAVFDGTNDHGFPSIVLRRSETRLGCSGVNLSIVDLGPEGRFLATKARVPEAAMKTAIDAGIAAKQLHSSWSEWSGDGEVALAVRLDDGPVAPRLYTSLPMGDAATAPLHGYLHGSFFPSSNRKTIDANIELNRLLLGEAASLAAVTVRWLARGDRNDAQPELLGPSAAARAAVDLLVWTNVSSLNGEDGIGVGGEHRRTIDLPAEVAKRIASPDGEFADAAAVPCLAAERDAAKPEPIAWCAPRSARFWNDTSETFSVACLAEHGHALGIAPLWPGLGEPRAKRLVAFLRSYAPDKFLEKPTPLERAKIAASVAASLPRGPKVAVARWTAFYRDLVSFMEESPAPLAPHKIILCSDDTLRARGTLEAVNAESGPKPRRRRRRGEKVEASLFFPPAPRATSDGDNEFDDGLRVPRQLKEYFAFASDALPWHGTLKRAREFLEGSLVAAYDSETVLTRISQVVNDGASVEEAIAGLRWAFAIWRRAGGGLFTSGRNYRLLVPTADQDLIPATEAVFSESWPDHTLGKRLKRFLDAGPAVQDIVNFGRRRLASISHRAFGKARITEWVEFLTALGVRRGLVAAAKMADRTFKAYELTSFSFCKEIGIPDTAAENWKADVEKFVQGGASFYYSTNYRLKGPLWWLPGQADHESFSNHCRELYASLIIAWLEHAPEALFSVEIVHFHYSTDTRRWPTPAAAFLRSANWMPADDPLGSGSVRDHFSPSDVWIAAASGERFPYYLRQPAVELAKAIERVGETERERLIKRTGLRVLGQRSTLVEQAHFLADQFRRGTVKRHYQPQFVNLYNSTWKGIADLHAAEPSTFSGVTAPPVLVVRRGGELLPAVPGSADTPAIYVRDNDDEIAVALINHIGDTILDVKGADRRRIGALFSALYGARVRLVSQLRYDVRADGTRIDELPRESTALDICPWLRPMAAVAIEALKGTDASQLPADRSSLLARLGSVGLRFAGAVVSELDGTTIPPDDGRRAYLFRRTDGPALVIALHVGPPNWTVVDDCLQLICDAIELPQIGTSMRLLARELMAADADVEAREIQPADLNRMMRTLHLDDDTCLAVRHLLSDRLDANLPWIRAVVHLAGGLHAVDAFDQVAVDAADPEVMRAALEPLLTPTGISSDAAIDASRRSSSTEQFRERLSIELADFNASLAAIGAKLETYPELHADQLRQYIADHELDIILALRSAVAPKLERYEPAPEYVHLRTEIRSMAPDPAWLPLYKMVPDPLVAARVEAWLAAAGAPPLGTNPHGLPVLQAVRKANLAAAAKFAKVAASLVRTWCTAHGRAAPDAWADPDAPDAKLRAALDAAGAMDFRELDEAKLLAWCTALGLWPAEMDRTLDRAALRIDITDIEAANTKAREEAEKREAKERSVRFDGRDEDPRTADWTNISEVIAAKLPKNVKETALGAFADLAPVVKREGSTGGSPSWRPRNPAPRIPQAKKGMIGRLGELVVYHWLKERLPNQDIDAAWVSKNGDAQLGRSTGSDDLGFDFRVEFRRQSWQIEVKASLGDQQRFEMSETEVRAAREAARSRSNTRYVVVYVGNPQDPANVSIDVLPNPMSAEADGMLELLGEGVRFGFKRQ